MPTVKEPQYDDPQRITYLQFLDSTEEHLRTRKDEIDGTLHFLTVTFAPPRHRDREDERSLKARSARSILKSFEYCYGCLMHSKKLLGNDYDRKAHLWPLAYVFADFSCTKGSPINRLSSRLEPSRADDRDPGNNPHIHAILVAHPHIEGNLDELGSEGLRDFFKRFCKDLATVDLQEIGDLRLPIAVDRASDRQRPIAPDRPLDPTREFSRETGALPYASKALKREWDQTGRADLYTILPDPDFRPPDRTERRLRVEHSRGRHRPPLPTMRNR